MSTVSPAVARRPARKIAIPKSVYFLFGLFIVLEYSRAPSLVPILGVIRSQMLLILALGVMWLRFGDRNDLRNPIVSWVLAFGVLCGLGILYTPNTRAAFNMMMNIFMYTAAVILPLLAFVRTVERLKWFLQLFVLANTFIAFWSLTHGGKGPGGFIADENDCALVLNVALPFGMALAVWPNVSKLQRLLWGACSFMLLLGAIATLSRGGFLGIVATTATAFWYSRNKMKVIGITLVMLAITIPLAPVLLPARYMAEVESIDDPNDSTRQNRLYFWKLGWIMYKANPVLGVGAGNYPWTVASYEAKLPPDQLFRGRYSGGRPSHSLYFTLLPELGTVGVIIFGTLVYRVVQTGRRVRIVSDPKKRPPRGPRPPPPAPPPPDLVALDGVGRAIVASCMAYLATGAFISVLYYPSFWHLAGIAATVGAIHASLLSRPAPAATQKETGRASA